MPLFSTVYASRSRLWAPPEGKRPAALARGASLFFSGWYSAVLPALATSWADEFRSHPGVEEAPLFTASERSPSSGTSAGR
jgi:hypothetical protein